MRGVHRRMPPAPRTGGCVRHAKPELPDDLTYCPAGMKDDMLAGGGFSYSGNYLYDGWHIAKAWIILGCSALALFIVADLLVHRFKNTNNLSRE
ncbi:hypothetical protein PG2029B_1228 [Bifidobacterium pseudolongum subsp. globosum]|uniref:Uncharacterized protein n=1 Tax=Bifidobacterium pseudolongum subsp. globosum TaxID=1690 RepID=A0A4Q5AF06_9BIFI|nr:hypothetical protein [Bifidobacterium pseudolongum]RYQ26631.1 hypothetical protein PG2032B_1227 [Bifidobacterium pseudolongum subsp. globosum]RYQ28623.1 hypothetical protein PG2029B_1228 [Bifidobacterium pseudolongum subsp. globosum]